MFKVLISAAILCLCLPTTANAQIDGTAQTVDPAKGSVAIDVGWDTPEGTGTLYLVFSTGWFQFVTELADYGAPGEIIQDHTVIWCIPGNPPPGAPADNPRITDDGHIIIYLPGNTKPYPKRVTAVGSVGSHLGITFTGPGPGTPDP